MAIRITIIGGGPGGYTAAFEAAEAGAEVTLVEKNALGGTCLHAGCIPTKALKASAEALETVRGLTSFGLTGCCEAHADMKAIVGRKRKIQEILRNGLEKKCARLNIQLVHGKGTVMSASRVKITPERGVPFDVQGDSVIIASGSANMRLPALPLDHECILSSDDALELDHVPARMIIVGGGVIGTELAFIFRALGSRVWVVEGQDRLLPLPSVDADISAVLQREMKKCDIELLLRHTVDSAVVADKVVTAVLVPSPLYDTSVALLGQTLEADAMIVAVGRTPDLREVVHDNLCIARDSRGALEADAHCRTSIPGIYAIGDVLGSSRVMLAHAASAEAVVAVANCMGGDKTVNYEHIPNAIFSSPEVGCIGLNEQEAVARGIDAACVTRHFRELGRAHASGKLEGMVKLVAERGTGKMLGGHIVGDRATDLLGEITLAVTQGITLRELAQTVHAHPTFAEIIFEAARHFEKTIILHKQPA